MSYETLFWIWIVGVAVFGTWAEVLVRLDERKTLSPFEARWTRRVLFVPVLVWPITVLLHFAWYPFDLLVDGLIWLIDKWRGKP